jgi:hypothetical protein
VAFGVGTLAPLLAAPTGPPGHIDNARLSETAGGAARRVFPPGTRVVYLNFDYDNMASHVISVTVRDAVGNELFTASRTLSGAGAETISLDSLVVVDRTYDALDTDATALVAAIDRALANIGDPVPRFQHTQSALAHASRMTTTRRHCRTSRRRAVTASS